MLRYFAAAIVFLLPTIALADDSPIVSACKQASWHWYMNEDIRVTLVQDFSNLQPPRVRVRLGDAISARCTFQSVDLPVQLIEYCTAFGVFPQQCQEAGDPQFDEVAELLRRDGY